MGLIAAVPTQTQTLPPNTIAIERWPEDVPCRVLKKYPDGYTCHFIRPNWTLPHRAEKAESGAGGVSAA